MIAYISASEPTKDTCCLELLYELAELNWKIYNWKLEMAVQYQGLSAPCWL